MGDVVGCEEGRDQMRDGAGLTTVRTKLKRVQSSLPGQRQTILSSTSSKISSILGA